MLSRVQPLFERRIWAAISSPQGKPALQSGDISAGLIPYARPERTTFADFPRRASPYTRNLSLSNGSSNLTRTQQPFVNVDPNIGNLFGNLPFSSAIRANHFPNDVQNSQMKNFTVPLWAMKVVSTEWDGTADQSVTAFYEKLKELFVGGAPVDALFGLHPLIRILVDETVYDRAPPLSK